MWNYNQCRNSKNNKFPKKLICSNERQLLEPNKWFPERKFR